VPEVMERISPGDSSGRRFTSFANQLGGEHDKSTTGSQHSMRGERPGLLVWRI
jgi:hypothetical protein